MYFRTTIGLMLFAIAGAASGVERKLTPVMGWSSWNSFGHDICKSNILAQADALVRLGLRDCGWTYVNIDDCYQMGRDAVTGRLKINLEKFPAGEADMKEIAVRCHALGLKAGMYSDGGDNCCASGNPDGNHCAWGGAGFVAK